MKRLEVRFRPEAEADFEAIFFYVLDKSRSPTVAAAFTRRIMARCLKIGDVPLGGRPRADLEPGLRTVPFEKSIVVAYKVDGDVVRITNLFAGGRDYEALYRNAPDD